MRSVPAPDVEMLTVTSSLVNPDKVAVNVKEVSAFSAILEALLAKVTVTPSSGIQEETLLLNPATSNVEARTPTTGAVDAFSSLLSFSQIFSYC